MRPGKESKAVAVIMVKERTNEKWVMSKEVCHSPMVWSITVDCPILTSTRIHLMRSGFNELGPYRIQKYHQSASDGGTSEEEDPCHRKRRKRIE